MIAPPLAICVETVRGRYELLEPRFATRRIDPLGRQAALALAGPWAWRRLGA
jgi:hypothetical protein